MVNDNFTALLATMAARGVDLCGFDAAAQRQAVDRRMRELGLTDIATYCDELTSNDQEPARLAEAVLLGYSAFLRDAEAWAALAEELAVMGPPVRAWSAGCGTGEEPYTVAMLLADALGREGLQESATVLASDVDDGALAAVRRGRYPATALRAVPRRWRRRYFRRLGDHSEVAESIRRCVTVARHDLVTDPVPAQLDVVVCRHTLMYFHPDTQGQILAGFAAALRPGGLLLCERTDRVDGDAWAPLGLGLHRRVASDDLA